MGSAFTETVETATTTLPIKKEETKTTEIPEEKVLTSKPLPQWEQHRPAPNDETISPADELPSKPGWYRNNEINEIERSMLPEWFNSSAPHRTPESYLKTREKIIEMSMTVANRNVTNSMVRRSILGDAGSLHRIRSFLVGWGIINEDGINDSAPTPASLRSELKRSAKFSGDMTNDLIVAVTQQAKKRRLKKDNGHNINDVEASSLHFDWEEVAALVGRGASAGDCQRTFMLTPLNEEPSLTLT